MRVLFLFLDHTGTYPYLLPNTMGYPTMPYSNPVSNPAGQI